MSKLLLTIQKWFKKNQEVKIFFLLTFISSAIFTFQIGKESFWLDEIYSVRYATHFSTFLSAVGNGASSERNMWLYYVLLFLWAHLGTTETIIRLLSALFGVLGILTVYQLGKEVYGKKVGLIAATLLITNTFYIQYAQEARAYSLLLLVFSISTLCMYRFGQKFTGKNGVLYGVAALAAIFTHIFSSLFIAFQGLFLLWQWRKSPRKLILIVLLEVALVLVLYQLIHNPGRQVGWIPKPQWIQFPLTYIFFSSGFVSALIYMFTIAWSFFKKRDTFFWYLVCIAIVPVILVFLYSMVNKPIFIYRYMIYAVPAIILLFSRAVLMLNKKYMIGVLTILILFQLNTMRIYFTTPNKEQWRDAVRTVAEQVKKNDLIVIFPAFLDGPFYYYREQNPGLKHIKTITALPQDQALNSTELIDGELAKLSKEIPEGGGVWLISRKENLPQIRAKQKKKIDTYLLQNFRREPHRYSFYQLDIEYFSQK
jgi:4-amino-4-deoxy-L-arabinose transferase-like glycosyltransferase